jgi:hypothetical protein
VNLATFTRITSHNNGPRLILEAPTQVARRELLIAAKKTDRTLKVLLHLSPPSRANKSFIYYRATRQQLRIEDRGDILIVYQQHNTHRNVKIDVRNSAHAVSNTLDTFLGELERPSQHRRTMQHTRGPPKHTHNTHLTAHNTNQHQRQYQHPHQRYPSRAHRSTHAPNTHQHQQQHQIPPPQPTWTAQPDHPLHHIAQPQNQAQPTAPAGHTLHADLSSLRNLLDKIVATTATDAYPQPRPTPLSHPEQPRVNAHATTYLQQAMGLPERAQAYCMLHHP